MALAVSYIPRLLECGTPNPRTRKFQTFVGFENHPLGRIQLCFGSIFVIGFPGRHSRPLLSRPGPPGAPSRKLRMHLYFFVRRMPFSNFAHYQSIHLVRYFFIHECRYMILTDFLNMCLFETPRQVRGKTLRAAPYSNTFLLLPY